MFQRQKASQKIQKRHEVQPNIKVKLRPKAIEDPLSNKKESLMQKAEEGVTKFDTQGATFLREINGSFEGHQ